MSAAKLLLVEDDPALSELLEYRFQNEGYAVRCTGDGDEALVLAAEEVPDLIILDWMIEGTSGIEVREAEDDRVRGLETGADDYLTKPFSPRELLARVAAVMRRIRPALAGETIEVGDLRLDPVAHKVQRRGRALQLGPTEYRLLKFFMESPGRVFSRGQLLDGVWGTGSDIELRTVDVHIRRLRKAITVEAAKDPIRTVRSAGYALEAV